MERRVPPTESSVSWKRGAFFYYTRTVTGSDYEQFLSSRDPCGTRTGCARRRGIRWRYRRVSSRSGSARSAPTGGSWPTPSTPPATRCTRCVPRPRPTAAVTFRTSRSPRTLLRRRVERRLAHVLLHRARRRSTGRTRSGGTRSARRPPTTCWSSPRTTPGSSSPCGPPAAGAYVFIETASRDTSETWLIPADDPTAAPRGRAPARRGVEYRVDHCRETDRLYIVTNDGAAEFRLMSRAGARRRPDWTERGAGRPGERLHACHVLRRPPRCWSCAATASRCCASWTATAGARARDRRRDRRPGTSRWHTPFEYDDHAVTVDVESLVAPPAWYDVDLRHRRPYRRASAAQVPGYDPAALPHRARGTPPRRTAPPCR